MFGHAARYPSNANAIQDLHEKVFITGVELLAAIRADLAVPTD